MSEIDEYADPEVYMDELEEGCDYGFGFCSDPETRSMGLCTTECSAYMDVVEEQDKEARERALKAQWPAKNLSLNEGKVQ